MSLSLRKLVVTDSAIFAAKERDAAGQIAMQLHEIRRVLKEADEVYRRFRASVLQDPPPHHLVSTEWIPLSDQ